MHNAAFLSRVGTCSPLNFDQKRNFYRILTSIANRPDRERIKEVGPERSCAEWLLRCGANVRWKGADNWLRDYNLLPPVNMKNYVIEELEAVEAGIMTIGFDHFDGCKNIRRARFHLCPYFEDETLMTLVQKLKDSLEHLEISSCGDITDRGLSSITQLNKLKTLFLQDLPEVKDKKGSYARLTAALPQCQIDYKDLLM